MRKSQVAENQADNDIVAAKNNFQDWYKKKMQIVFSTSCRFSINFLN